MANRDDGTIPTSATSSAGAAEGEPQGPQGEQAAAAQPPLIEPPTVEGAAGPDPRMFSPAPQPSPQIAPPAPPGMDGDQTPRTQHLNTTAAVPTSPLGTPMATPTMGPMSEVNAAGASSSGGTKRMLFARPKPVFTRDISTPPCQESTLMDTILALQAQLDAVTQQLEALKNTKGKEQDVPTMHIKDVDKPFKFNGERWTLWEGEFTNFLARRDRRWKVILGAVKAHSGKPLTPEQIAAVCSEEHSNGYLTKDDVYEAFTEHLYEYLKSYTLGEVYSMVMANGVDRSFESWRRLCDQGRSRRDRPMRDERRALYHPKHATADGLIKAIAECEKKLAEYISVKPNDAMGEKEKIMCLEDLCPEKIQKFLSEKVQNGNLNETFMDYKDAIDQYFLEEKRWTSTTRNKINSVTEQQKDEDLIQEPTCWPCGEYQPAGRG